jgi:hypothetical protein
MSMSSHASADGDVAAASRAIAGLDRKLAHVLEPAMRRALVREALRARGPDGARELLRQVLCRGPRDDGAGSLDRLRETLQDLLLGPAREGDGGLGYDFRRRLYEVAVREGDEMVMRMLRSLPAREAVEQPELCMSKELADIPLGRRRSLAKGEETHWLEALALDPDRVVIRNLLCNPKLVEADVVRIAALRPVAASTLVEVGRCQRWIVRPRVRVALARNPYTPAQLAIKLVSSLPLPDLRAMRSDPDLHAETLHQVELELERRAG